MAAALPLNIAPQLQAYLQAPLPLDTIDILKAVLLDAPPSFTEATRPIQINGLLLGVTENGVVSLRTAAGEVSLQLAAPSQDALFSIERNVASTSRSDKMITLLVQPEAKMQATLLVPKNDKININAQNVLNETKISAKETLLKGGGKLTLTVLPDDIEKSLLAPEKNKIDSLLTKPLLSASSEKAVEKAFGDLQKSVETLVQKTVTEKQVVDVSSPKTLTKPHPDLQTGGDIKVVIDKIIPPEKDFPDNLAANTIRASVAGKSPSGHLVLNSEGKTLFVQQSGDLPVGTKMTLTLVPRDAADQNLTPLKSDRDWPALRELAANLAESSPPIAHQFMHTKIPSPTQNMAATTLFFLNALQAGKINDWLGLPVHMSLIKMNKKEVIDKLITDITEASRTASDTRAGEWKSYPIPVHFGQDFDMLKLYVRDATTRDSKQQEQKTEIKKTHFVITMNMSRLGPVQMEGLSRPQRLDLVIRSEKDLPLSLPASIRQTYLNCLESVGLTGTLTFQTGHQNWIAIKDNALRESGFVL